MSLEIWLAYVATLLAFMVTPGPSHLLMLSNAMTHGFRPSLATAAGDLTANALQMLAAGVGLAAILIASQNALLVIKWLGVAYLVWMGLRKWQAARGDAARMGAAATASARALWLQGFLTSAANPKAVVFFTALFPQFIETGVPFWPQFLALSATYIAVDGAFLVSYGAGAGWLSERLKGPARVVIHRLGAVALIVAGVLLGFKSIGDVRH